GARSMVIVTVLPARSRSTVPKFPVPKPEPPLPCVRLTMQLVVEAQISADAGLAKRMPARLPPATMVTSPNQNRLKLILIESSPPVFLAFCDTTCTMQTAMKGPDIIIQYLSGLTELAVA